MLGNMKPREKVLMAITIIALLIFAAWQFGLEDVLDSVTSGTSDVEVLESRFRENLKILENREEIERRYARVGEFPQAENENLKPALAFTQQVSQMCRDHGFDFPPIRPEVEEIEGVSGYELVNVAIKTEGKFKDTVELMKTFDSNGLIFREVDLQTSRDSDIIVARITVARIAPRAESRSSLISRRRL